MKIDPDFIADLTAREERMAEGIADGVRERGWAKNTIAPFYPELFAARATHVTALPGIPITSQLPFFVGCGLLVQIEPFRNPEKFLEHYGVDVRTMVNLVQRGQVIPIISSDLHRYLDLDYLAPLLVREPTIVASVRTRYFFLLQSPLYDTLIAEGESRLADLQEQSGEWDTKYRTGKEAYVTARAKRYARVKVLHPEFSERIDEAIAAGPEAAQVMIDMLDLVLVDRHTSAFEGTLTINGADYRRAVQKVPELSGPDAFAPFHTQIAQNVLDYFRLTFPNHLTLGDLDLLERSEIPSRLRELMSALNEAASAPDSGSIDENAAELVQSWQEVTHYLDVMLKNKSLVDDIAATGVVLLSGAAGWYVGGGGLIGTGVGAAGISAAKNVIELPLVKRIRAAIAEQAVKFQKPKVATLMFDFKKSVDSFKTGR